MREQQVPPLRFALVGMTLHFASKGHTHRGLRRDDNSFCRFGSHPVRSVGMIIHFAELVFPQQTYGFTF
jgi:hypothetical protein